MYVTFAELKAGSAFDPIEWDELNTRRPATVAMWLELTQATIDDPLRLRYAVPFDLGAPPRSAKAWQILLMDEFFLSARRTPGAETPQDAAIVVRAEGARVAIAAAADQDRPAHAELPLRSDVTTSGVSKGGPMMSSFVSMHEWFDHQALRRDAARGGG